MKDPYSHHRALQPWTLLVSIIFISLWTRPLFSEIGSGFASTLSSPNTAQFDAPIYFESDNLEYRQSDQVITASGNVKVEQSSYSFSSDYGIFNLPQESLTAWGRVQFSDNLGNQIKASRLQYSAAKGSAKLEKAVGAFGAWKFAAKRAERDDQGNFYLDRARLTTCEADLSKYHLYGHKIKVLPKKRLTVHHALFKIGPVPVLYLPYYYHSLGEKHLAFNIYPGQNRSEGFFVRTKWGYPVTDLTYVKLYLDHLSKRGFGTGTEVSYYYKDILKGSVYGYRITDRVTDRERWNARLQHWQKITQNLIVQSNINQLSDDTFPNDFFREDFDRVVRDFRSSVVATYQKKGHYLRLIGEREDEFSTDENDFFPREYDAPSIDYTHTQTPIGFLGLEKITSFNFANRFSGDSFRGERLPRRLRRQAFAQGTLLRKFRLNRRATTFVPRVSFRNQWTDRLHGVEGDQNFVQLLTAESTLRQRLGYSADVDFSYRFSQRLQNNRGPDNGREEHFINILTSVRPTLWFSLRLQTTHDLPRNDGEALAFLERKNYRPIQGEISINPTPNSEIFFREEYTLHDGTGSIHPLSTMLEFSLGRRAGGGNYFSLGSSYFSSDPGKFEFRQSGRITINERFRIEGVIRSNIFYDNGSLFNIRDAELTEEEVSVWTQWRCWNISFTFRERTGVVEFLFNLELQLDRVNREQSEQPERDAEWYPWRE